MARAVTLLVWPLREIRRRAAALHREPKFLAKYRGSSQTSSAEKMRRLVLSAVFHFVARRVSNVNRRRLVAGDRHQHG